MRLRGIGKLVMTSSDPAFAVDGSGRIAAWNSAAEAVFALSARDAIGRHCHEVVQGTDESGPVCSAGCTNLQALSKNEAVGNFDLQVRTANGIHWCNVSVLTASGEESKTRYSIHVIHDIDADRRLGRFVRNYVLTHAGLPAKQAHSSIAATRYPAREIWLSTRELEVLKLLAQGATTRTVAEQLHLTTTTVKNHVQHILRKLDSHTRMEAIRNAEHRGLI